MSKQSLSGTFAHRDSSAAPGPGLKFIVSAFPTRAGLWVDAAWRVMLEWQLRRRSRRILRSLSRREISDFSRDLSAAEREARKPFWRA